MNSEEKEMVDTLFDKYLEDGKAVIFTRGENSPFNFQMIKKVRKLLLETEIEFKEIDISKHQNEHFIQCTLNIHTGFNSFPNIYFGNTHVGGYDDLVPLFSDKEFLEETLSKAKIESKFSASEQSDGFDTDDFKRKTKK